MLYTKQILISVDYFDIDLNTLCAAETKLLKVVMVSDILNHPVHQEKYSVAL